MARLAIIGNSICAGAYATSANMTLHAQLLRRLRESGERWTILSWPSDAMPRIGHAYMAWERVRSARPDLLVVAGFGENDYSSSVSSLADLLTVSGNFATFNTPPVAGRCYVLTDGQNEEAIIPRLSQGLVGQALVRGVGGSTPRMWPAGTQVISWPDNVGQPGLQKAMYYTLKQIAMEACCPILVGAGDVFAGMDSGHGPTLQAVIQSLRLEGFGVWPVPFLDDSGEELFRPGAPTAFTGPTDYLAAAIDAAATSMTVVNGDRIDRGDYLVLSSDGAVPTFGNSEIVKVIGRMSQTNLSIQRAQLGSTARAFSAFNRVMRLSQAYTNPRAPFANVGTSTNWVWVRCSHDRHPWDTGYMQLAKRYFEVYRHCLQGR